MKPTVEPDSTSPAASQAGADLPSGPVTFKEVFTAEIGQIRRSRKVRAVTAKHPEHPERSLIGLAFSGGGIRSATFNLGILQALAKNHLLHYFDYLSTVSGGGYIGGWLAALTERFREAVPSERSSEESFKIGEVVFHETVSSRSYKDIEDALAPEEYKPDRRRERSFLHWLRLYSNYLTPHKSLL